MINHQQTDPTYLVVGTAGHIDHGKTSLVKALTGIDTDTHREEKARGITIDLGFAFLDDALDDGSPLRVSFVDVPGHKLFVRNMLAGAGGINCVLLVIAADDGIRPQTVEHLEICSLLGIDRGITVLTKIDAVSPDRLETVHTNVEEFLSGTFLDCRHNPILHVSSLQRTGLNELKAALRKVAHGLPSQGLGQPARLPIDRSFSITGAGTVVTGTLVSGQLTRGQSLVLEPSGKEVRVRNIQVHSSHVQHVASRTRVALNLSGVERDQVRRGDTLVSTHSIAALDLIDVELSLSPGATTLKHRSMVHLHVFATDVVARVNLYSQTSLTAGSRGLARLKLMSPILVARGDRFVLRQPSPVGTIGGGIVIEAQPLPGIKKLHNYQWLRQLQEIKDPADELVERAARRGMQGLELSMACREMLLTGEEIKQRLLPSLTQKQRLLLIGGECLITSSHYHLAIEHFDQHLAQLLKARPHEGAVRKAELLNRSKLPSGIFGAIVAQGMQDKKLRVSGDLLAPAGYHVGASVAEKRIQLSILAAFKKSPLAARSIPEVLGELCLDPQTVRPLVTSLLRERLLIPVDGTLFLHHDSVSGLATLLAPYRGKALNVQQFKNLTGLTRKHAIPLLEFLDKSKLTRRDGDSRLVL